MASIFFSENRKASRSSVLKLRLKIRDLSIQRGVHCTTHDRECVLACELGSLYDEYELDPWHEKFSTTTRG